MTYSTYSTLIKKRKIDQQDRDRVFKEKTLKMSNPTPEEVNKAARATQEMVRKIRSHSIFNKCD